MKIINDIIKNSVIKKWKVPSKSKIGVHYIISLFNNGDYSCDCFAGKRNKTCSHINIVKLWKK